MPIFYAFNGANAQTHCKSKTSFTGSDGPLKSETSVSSPGSIPCGEGQKATLKAGQSSKTTHHALALVRQVWNLAHRDGFVQGANPVTSVRKPKELMGHADFKMTQNTPTSPPKRCTGL